MDMDNKMSSSAKLSKDKEEVDLTNMDWDTFYEEYLKSDSDSDFDSDLGRDSDEDTDRIVGEEELFMKELYERDLYDEDFCEQPYIEANDEKYDVY